MKTARKTIIPALTLAAVLIPALASAQQYQPWNNLDTASDSSSTQGILNRLDTLIDEAEKSRTADPRFLRDLRKLSDDYRQARPQASSGAPVSRRTLLLSDDFADGDFIQRPRWTVTVGKYWVENGWGLRSAVKAEAASAPEQQRLSGKEAAAAIFGQILQQAIDPNRQSGGGQAAGTSTGTVISPTAIQTRIKIPNAFAIEVDFSSWAAQGRLEIGPYQGAPGGGDRAQGYHVAYTPGGGLELLRTTRRGTALIDSAPGQLNLEDKKSHRLEWTRSASGVMTASIDGLNILTATDQTFQGEFDGLRTVNRGGDYIFKRVTVYGAQ